jgi:hypothetical protein
VSGRDAREARTLGLWTASWLGVLLLAGLLWLGDLWVQWPVLLVPVLWGLVALRPRRSRAARRVDGAAPVRTDTVAWPTVPPSQDRRRRPR